MQPNALNGSSRPDPCTGYTSPRWGYPRASSSTKSSSNKLTQCNASNGSSRPDPCTDRTSPQWGYPCASSSTKSSNCKLTQSFPKKLNNYINMQSTASKWLKIPNWYQIHIHFGPQTREINNNIRQLTKISKIWSLGIKDSLQKKINQ
jgi:hypothetical protein